MLIYQKFLKYWEKYPIASVVLFFTFLTAVFTYPLVFHFGSQLPQGGGDTFQGLANIDAQVRALQQLDLISGAKYFLSKLGTYSPYVLLNLFFNKYVAWNMMFALSYVLSGVGAYLLAYHFTRRRGAALLAGILFAFNPFHYYQTTAVHLGSMQQQWIPFAALFLLKFLEDFKCKNYLGFLVFLLLLAISEHQLLAFSLLFFLVLVVVRILQERSLLKNKKLWTYLAVSGVFFALVVFTVFGDLLKVATSADNFLAPGSGAAKKYAMNAWEVLLPPGFHTIWPGINSWLRNTVGIVADSRDSYFVGFTTLVMLGILFWQYVKSQKSKVKSLLQIAAEDKKGLLLWGWAFVAMYVFAWGPGFKLFNIDWPLPYMAVYKFLPFYENIRVTGRLFMFAILALAILLAYAVKYVQPQLKNVYLKKYLVPGLAVLLLVEFWVAPLKLMAVDYSSFYAKLAAEPGAFKILEVPGSTDYEFASYKLQTNNLHGKVSVDGMALARSIDGQYNWQRTTPVIKQLLYTLPKGNDPEKAGFEVVADNYFTLGTDILNYNNIRYVTLSKKYLEKAAWQQASAFVEKYLAIDSKFEDQYLVAYKIKTQPPQGFYAKIDSSSKQWSIDVKDGTAFAKKAGNGATVTIFNLGAQKMPVKVKLLARSAGAASFTLNGQKFVLSGAMQEFSIPVEVLPGENVLTLEILDAQNKPLKINARKKGKEGILVQKIVVEKQ